MTVLQCLFHALLAHRRFSISLLLPPYPPPALLRTLGPPWVVPVRPGTRVLPPYRIPDRLPLYSQYPVPALVRREALRVLLLLHVDPTCRDLSLPDPYAPRV